MNRRNFLGRTMAGGLAVGAAAGAGAGMSGCSRNVPWSTSVVYDQDLVIEKPLEGQPHAGKVLASIEPHSDDSSIFWSGTIAKLIREGYTGYLIRTSNDEKCGPSTPGEAVKGNQIDSENVAKVLGLKDVVYLDYRNHRMDGIEMQEFRGRLIFLIRALKIDTILTYDPWGHYEENPDHYITAMAVESACWMAGMNKDYPEQFDAGIEPYKVSERYYFARGPQLVNRVIDISGVVDIKREAMLVNKTQGPYGRGGERLRQQLAAEGLTLPELGTDDDTSNRKYIELFACQGNRALGEQFGLQYAEKCHYIDQRPHETYIDDYVKRHAVPL